MIRAWAGLSVAQRFLLRQLFFAWNSFRVSGLALWVSEANNHSTQAAPPCNGAGNAALFKMYGCEFTSQECFQSLFLVFNSPVKNDVENVRVTSVTGPAMRVFTVCT